MPDRHTDWSNVSRLKLQRSTRKLNQQKPDSVQQVFKLGYTLGYIFMKVFSPTKKILAGLNYGNFFESCKICYTKLNTITYRVLNQGVQEIGAW
jgi:hypothetical protein